MLSYKSPARCESRRNLSSDVPMSCVSFGVQGDSSMVKGVKRLDRVGTRVLGSQIRSTDTYILCTASIYNALPVVRPSAVIYEIDLNNSTKQGPPQNPKIL